MDHINDVISLQQLNEGVKKRYLRQILFSSAKSIFNNLYRFLLSAIIFDDETYKNMYVVRNKCLSQSVLTYLMPFSLHLEN